MDVNNKSEKNYFQILMHRSSICCPLTFCREEKKTQGAAYITPASTQCSLVQREDRCTRNQDEQMQSFASCLWSLTLAFFSWLGKSLQVSIPHTSCIPASCHYPTKVTHLVLLAMKKIYKRIKVKTLKLI